MRYALFAIFALSVTALLCPEPADAQTRGNRVGSSKASPKNKTRSEIKKLLSQDVKRTVAKTRAIENRMNDFADFMKISPGLRTDKAALAQVRSVINAHGEAKREHTRLTQIKFSTYAAQRGFRMIPDPPRTPPPPLPQQLRPPAAKASVKQAKSRRPPQ